MKNTKKLLAAGVLLLLCFWGKTQTPSISAGGSTAICLGETVNLTANGAAGKAIQVSGTAGTNQGYVNVPDANSLDFTTAFTLEAWVNPNAYANNSGNYANAIVSKNRASGGIGYALALNPTDGKLQALTNNGTSNQFVESSAAVPLNSWTHVAGVFNGTSLTIFINGVQAGQSTFSSMTLLNSTQPVRIGMMGPGLEDWIFNGQIDEVRLWNTARTQAQISANMGKEIAVQTGLVGYYKLNEGTGTSVADASSSNNSATFGGTNIAWVANSGASMDFNSYSWSPGGATTKTVAAGPANTYVVTVTNGTGTTATASQAITLGAACPAGAALHFDGTNDRMTNSSIFTTAPAAFTVEFWVKPTQLGNHTQFLGATAAWGAFMFHSATDGKIYVGTNLSNRIITAANVMVANTWQHFAFSFANGTGTLYKNGVQVASASMSTPTAWNGFIMNDGVTNTFDGTIDELRIWNTARSQNQLQNSINCELDATTSGLVAYYKFNQSSGTTLTDATSNAHNATLTNFSLSGNTSNWVTVGSVTTGATCAFASIAGNFTACNSTTLTASGGNSYLWNTGATTASITATTSATYSVTVTAVGGATGTASQAVTINPAPNISIAGATTACQQVSLTASGGATYAWSNGSTSAAANFSASGNYTVTATAANGCTATASQAVTVNTASAIIAGPTTACDQADLTASGGSTYVWTGGTTGATAHFSTAGTYSVTATAANGCTATASHTVQTVLESVIYYDDADNDGYGDNAHPTASCTPIAGKTTVGGDCDDSNFDIRPGVVEDCDAVDNNCNGILIEGNCPGSAADVSPNCFSTSSQNVLTGEFYFNYGSVSGALNPATRASFTVGQPVVGTQFGADLNGGYGFWSRFLLAPSAPKVSATEGDLPDRVQISWKPDPLSPAAASFKLYRNGALLATVDGQTFSFMDFNVLAGQFYTYEVSGVSDFGEGYRGSALGFLNPNGVVTGQVKSFSGNPVVGAVVKLSPTIGTALEFDGKSTAFAEYASAVFPTEQFTISCWVKQGAGNDESGIFDLGSSISKNWWLHTLPNGAARGVKFGIGAGTATEISHEFPAATAADWHYVAASYNGSALLFYVDGELVGTAVGEIEADSSLFFLGKRGDAGGFFNGKIDEVRIFDRQLAQTEIQMVMNQTVSATTPGLKIYWKFDEGVGSKGFDLAAGKTKIYLCGPTWTTDKPEVVNAGMTTATGFYKIEGVNYSAGTTFTAMPTKNFYFNQSLEFNAANETSATLTDFDLPDSSTVEITVKNFDFSANQTLLDKSGHFSLKLNAGNIALEMGGTSHDFGVLGTGFHRLSFVLKQNGSAVEVNFYKNGEFVGSHNFAGVATNFAGGSAWTLGKNSSGNFFTGLIDEVAFFSTLLPLADLQAHANIGTNVTHPKLAVYFNLNESEGSVLHDMGTSLTGNGLVSDETAWSTVAAISEVLPHEFTPESRLVTLNPSNTSADQIDFTDQSTIPISGYVRFENTNCFQQGVEILVNGKSHVPQIFTNGDGKFSVDVEPGETVRLTPKFEQHTFYPAFWDLQKVSSPVAGILFRNQTKRKVFGQLAGNETCRKSIIPAGAIVKVKVATLSGCYEQVKILSGNGKFTFDNVPPDSVTVAVIEHSNPVIYTFFQNKGGATLDLKNQNDTIDFIYLAPPEVELSPLATNSCGDPMLEMQAIGQTVVKVFEQYDGGVCYLDSAKLTINNGISDLPQFDTVMTEGQFKYRFKAGAPQIAAPHLKFLQVTAEAHDEQASASQSAVVLGRRARQTTFASTSPEIPTLILRDPPGDGSFSFIEKGETTCQNWAFAAAYGSNLDVSATISLGADLTTSVGLGAEVELEIDATLDMGIETSTKFNHLTTNESETCVTTTERIATSDNDQVVGSAGGADVYMGGAINYIFGITDELEFDSVNCSFYLDKGLVVFPDGFATTFIYSEYQIKTVVIPNLLTIGDTISANRWLGIIALNDSLKREAVFSKNISFDAGVVYEQSETTEATKSITHEWSVEFDAQFVNEFGLEVNGVGLSAGLRMGFTTTQTSTAGASATDSRTVGFTLMDNDLRDNFTVNIKKDKAYGTPVFETVSGQSACPWEPNTQPREEVQISIDKNVAVNIPENDVAVFQINLGNTSPSGEVGFYFLEPVPESNPFGAQLTANGVPLEGGLLYQIPPNGSLPLTITIGKGAVEYDYTGIRIAAHSGCEFDGAIEIGIPREEIDPKFYKEVVVDVHFLEPCSPVDVSFPLPDWVFINSMGNSMNITLGGYDNTDPDLELVRVQYRRSQGDGAWINIAEIPKADLGDVFEIVPWSLPMSFKDGFYEIRAVTQCFSGALNPGISKVVKGKIERTPPEIFGTPEPADGVLSSGDEISIRFTEEIRCDQLIQADQFDNNNVGLYNTRTGNLVDAIITCSGDKITIVPNVPNQFLENDILRVEVDNIKDLANNQFSHADWEFVVDRNPLNWLDNVPVYVSKYEEDIRIETRRLQNRGGFNQSFEITGLPSWVLIYPSSGTLAPGAVQEITFQFDSTLVFGNYQDTIFAESALGDEPLQITARVVCHDPGWTVNAKDFDYSMNFTAQLDIEGTVSEDREDIVGAFVGSELRGVARLEYVAAVNKHLAFLTVYSNNFSGETVNFRIWDASECLLYGSVLETFAYQADGLLGNPQVPTLLHTNNQVLREIELGSGWNWISFNLALLDNSVAAALAGVTDPTGDLIKSQTQFAQNSAGLGWLGSLSTLGNTSMYQYRTADADTILHLGTLIDPTTMPIPVAAGWNWIGYLPQKALTVSEALGSLTPLNGDLVKSQTEFAQFVAGFGWIGNLKFMSPPNGYLLKMANAGVLTYPNTANRPTADGRRQTADGAKALGRSEIWTVDATKFEHSQTMIAMLKNEGKNVTGKDFELGAFTLTGECRGAARAIWIEPLQSHLFFLTMYANQSGEVFNFKMADEKGQISDLKETIFFASDAQIGSVQQPFEFQFGTSASDETEVFEPFLDVLPNPVVDYATIRFRTAEAGSVRFEISDAAGKLVQTFDYQAIRGMNALLWQDVGDLPKGVYLLKMSASGLVLTEKVVVR